MVARLAFQTFSYSSMRSAMSQRKGLRVIQIQDHEAGRLIGSFADANWRQFPSYSLAAARQIGASSEYAAVYDGDELLGMANIRIRNLPVIPGGIAFVSHGPMTVLQNGKFDADRYAAVIGVIAEQYTGSKGFCLRVENALNPREIERQREAALSAAGFEPVGSKRYQTFLLDLSPGEDALRKGLNGKWRTDLNRAERQDLRVTQSSDPEDFDSFAPLLDHLSEERGFSAPQDTAFFREVAKQAADGERIAIHLAYLGEELVAGHVGAFSGGTAVYLLGAANAKGRNCRAAYLLQWAVINHAIDLGMRYYDLGGADEAENPSVFRFKKRMGGQLVRNLPTFQRWPRQPGKATISAAEWIYRKLKER